MSTEEPAPLVPLDRPAPGRPGRRRTALVVLPLLLGVAVAGGFGGQLLLSPGEDAAAADDGLTCWDGDLVEAAADCPKPRGAAGLAWVFPSFDRDALECVDELVAHPEYTRPEMWTCEQVIGGRPVRVTYSEVSGTRPALRFLDELHGRDARSTGRTSDGRSAVYTWRPSQAPGGPWTASLLLRDAPFAVTVSATSRADAARALERRVRVRPPDERRVS